MGILIHFSPVEEAKLREAAAQEGQDVADYTRRLITGHLLTGANSSADHEGDDQTLALLAEWDAEDSTDDPAEVVRRAQEWEELKAQMNATRFEAGARLLFP